MIGRGLLRFLRRIAFSDSRWAWIRNYRLRETIMGPLTYNEDGLATTHNCDFLQDRRFQDAYSIGKGTGSWGSSDVHWRAYVICWAASRGLSLDGDFVECGVNRGGYARAVIAYTGFEKLPRKFYLLDTFSGLVEKYISDEERTLGRSAGGYEECYEAVCRTFEPFHNVSIVRGAVPDTLTHVKSERVAFLSIDMNCAPPEVAAAEFFWDRLSSGAVMVFDDYGFSGHIVQKRATDTFAASRGVQVLALPTGQGVIIKP